MIRVMIADDSEFVRDSLKSIIKAGHHELAAEAIDGEDAISKYNESNPDVLLLDIEMPKKDGLLVIKELIQNGNPKIIMITGQEDMIHIQNCIEAGALAYLIKPFKVSDVLNSIEFVSTS